MEDLNNEDMMGQILEEMDKCFSAIESNIDYREKKVGDRVKVWDGSCNIDKNTGEHRSGIDPLFENYKAIIIETNLNIEYNIPIGEEIYTDTCDVLLKFPNGEEVYCNSMMTKRTDDYEN